VAYISAQPNMAFENTGHYYYAHYYAVQVMYQAGDEHFNWYPKISKALLEKQNEDGSYPPEQKIDLNQSFDEAAKMGYKWFEPMVHYGRELMSEAAFVAERRRVKIGLEPHAQYSKTPDGLDRICSLVGRVLRGNRREVGRVVLVRRLRRSYP